MRGLKDLAEQSPTKQDLRLRFVFTDINALPPWSPAQACVRNTFLEFGHLPQAQNTTSPTQWVEQCFWRLGESSNLPLRIRWAGSLEECQVQQLAILRDILWGCGGTVAFMDLCPGGERGRARWMWPGLLLPVAFDKWRWLAEWVHQQRKHNFQSSHGALWEVYFISSSSTANHQGRKKQDPDCGLDQPGSPRAWFLWKAE